MGECRVKLKISPLHGKRRTATVRLLVDTGATLSVVPSSVLRKIGVVPRDTTTMVLADGREVTRKVGGVWFDMKGLQAPALVVFEESKDEPIVGVTVLEQLKLAIDPVRGRLVPGRFLYL